MGLHVAEILAPADPTPSTPTVGVVVPATGLPGEVPVLGPEQLAALQRAQQRDKAYADAKAVAARMRKRPPGTWTDRNGYDIDEVELLIAYFLDHG